MRLLSIALGLESVLQRIHYCGTRASVHSRVATVYFHQVSPGTHLSISPKGDDDQLGDLHADSSGRNSNPGSRIRGLAR